MDLKRQPFQNARGGGIPGKANWKVPGPQESSDACDFTGKSLTLKFKKVCESAG